MMASFVLILFAIMLAPVHSIVQTVSTASAYSIIEEQHFKTAFYEGFCVGFMTTIGFDYVREYSLPNLNSLNLHEYTGICRDQLAGQMTMLLSLVGLSMRDVLQGRVFGVRYSVLGARGFGVMVGSAVAKIARHAAS